MQLHVFAAVTKTHNSYLSVRSGVDPVVIDPALVAQRDGQLTRTALALPNQEAAVDQTAEQVLGRAAGHGPMIPAVLLQAVHGGDVVTGHPTLTVLGAHLAPLAILVVAQHSQLFS